MRKTIFFLILFALLLPVSLYSHEKHIFVVESYHAEYPWDISYKKGLGSILASEYKLIYFEMDTKRLPVSEHQKVSKKKMDIIWNEIV